MATRTLPPWHIGFHPLINKRFPCLFSLAALLAISPARAEEPDACEQLPKPSVTIKHLEEEISFNTRYGYRQLTSMSGQKLRPGSRVLGLTRTNGVAQFSLNMPAIQDASERYECASPQITLTIGFKQMTVYIGKEFPVGSCAYEEILEHEMRHVKTYQAHIVKIEQAVREDISRRFVTDSVWRGLAGVGFARVQKELEERWLPYVNREMQKVEMAQALIDTPEEYARLSEACGGEVKKLAR